MMSNDKSDGKCDGKDYVVPGPSLPDGRIVGIRHTPDHTAQPVILSHSEDGKPIPEDASILQPREGSNILDVIGTVSEMKAKKGPTKGPAKVNSASFQSGWDNIFGAKKDSTLNLWKSIYF